jgi:hypothetical protein
MRSNITTACWLITTSREILVTSSFGLSSFRSRLERFFKKLLSSQDELDEQSTLLDEQGTRSRDRLLKEELAGLLAHLSYFQGFEAGGAGRRPARRRISHAALSNALLIQGRQMSSETTIRWYESEVACAA